MTARNRFREGSFAPVEEEITAFDLPVTGTVPAELNGRYLRNGPSGSTQIGHLGEGAFVELSLPLLSCAKE